MQKKITGLFVCLVTRSYKKQMMKMHLCHIMWKTTVWLLLLIFLRHFKRNQNMCVPVAITCCFRKHFNHSTLQTTMWMILLGNVYPLDIEWNTKTSNFSRKPAIHATWMAIYNTKNYRKWWSCIHGRIYLYMM